MNRDKLICYIVTAIAVAAMVTAAVSVAAIAGSGDVYLDAIMADRSDGESEHDPGDVGGDEGYLTNTPVIDPVDIPDTSRSAVTDPADIDGTDTPAPDGVTDEATEPPAVTVPGAGDMLGLLGRDPAPEETTFETWVTELLPETEEPEETGPEGTEVPIPEETDPVPETDPVTEETTPRETPPPLSDEMAAAIIAEAEKYLGVPFIDGGSDPSTGFDCSGYIWWVMNRCGLSVDRTSASGLYAASVPVTRDEVRPGDLVFFKNTYQTTGISHVGIYVGDGKMIHCSNSGVIYSNITSGYWRVYFYSYGRLPH